jgi:photosystem II stability/assembly factor-like uncharacterized protein
MTRRIHPIHRGFCGGLAVLLLLAATAAAQDGWTCITKDLWSKIDGYRDSWSGNRRCGGLAVHPKTGRVYLSINGKYGLYASDDEGKTFDRADGGKLDGRWVDPCAIHVDPTRAGAVAVFKVGRASGMTLDGGKTWTVFTNKGKDGWGYGCVDWTQGKPRRIVAHEHHSRNFWYSEDAGQTWTKIENTEKCNRIGLAADAILTSRRREGILRSEDLGKTWKKVSDASPVVNTPRRYGDTLYWLTDKGLAISDDEGLTWRFCARNLAKPLAGPHFGLTPTDMIVLTEEAYMLSRDAGKTWKKVADFYLVPRAYKDRKDLHDFGWDPEAKILYVAGLGSEACKLQLETDERSAPGHTAAKSK